VWVARLLVAVVFGWAAIAKLMDRAGTREALEAFGVPSDRIRQFSLPW
jgi:uncharacterized membrane protein YphA (DoxX/SURF4 family)